MGLCTPRKPLLSSLGLLDSVPSKHSCRRDLPAYSTLIESGLPLQLALIYQEKGVWAIVAAGMQSTKDFGASRNTKE